MARTALKWFPRRAVVAAVTGLMLVPAAASAALVIDVGDIRLEPDQAGQAVEFLVTGDGDAVDALEFNIQVGDGATTGPLITAIDLKTGTPFAGAAHSQQTIANTGRLASVLVDGPLDADVAAAGRIATVTFDTTGLHAGSFPLTLNVVVETEEGPQAFPTTFRNDSVAIPLTLIAGTIAVPEPAGLAALGLAGLALVRRRRRA